MTSTIIGLSFGNTSSSIAYLKDGKAEVIANPDGDRAIPSVLSYVAGDEFHGVQAKHQLVRNPRSTVAYFRDFVGKEYSAIDPSAAHKSAHPVEKDGKVGFVIPEAETERFLSVDDAVIRQLSKLGEAATDYLGRAIDGVVLAVPSDFNQAQRKLLADLSGKANLPVLQVINEPTAALLAHVSRTECALDDKLYLVTDFGGTRSDGAIIAYNGGIFTILATRHDPELGGNLLDEVVVGFLAKEFEKQHKIDPLSDPRAVAKLTLEAEQIRKTLSNSTSAQYSIESLTQGIDFSGSLNRLRFDTIARSVLGRFTGFVESLVSKANLDLLDIDDVLLVGGVSWTPKIAANIKVLFPSKEANVVAPSTDVKAIDPDELISRGAAIQGSLLAGFDAEEIAESQQPVVVNGPHLSKALGIVQKDGVVEVLPANTLLPARKNFSLAADDENVLIKVVEVEEEIVTETKKPEPVQNEDGESDWSEDDEEYEERSIKLKAGKDILEVASSGPGNVQLVITVSKDGKVGVSARSAAGETTGGSS